MASPGSDSAVELTAEQRQVFAGLASRMWLVSLMLLVIAALRLVLGALTVWQSPATGILSLVEGLVAGFMGMALMTGSGDANFLAQTRGYEKKHLLNTAGSLNVFYTAQLALGTLVAVALVILLFV
jgi:hypothetical protein